MKTKEITKGEFKKRRLSDCYDVVCLSEGYYDKVMAIFPISTTAEGNAELIAEAFNVYNETSKTPRELVNELNERKAVRTNLFNDCLKLQQQNKELLEALKSIRSLDPHYEEFNSPGEDFSGIANEAIKKIEG